MTVFLIVGAVFTVIAALLHVFIFLMESVLWLRPSIYERFGIQTDDEAATVQPMAFNQGFYNLFLGLGALLGLFLVAFGQRETGLVVSLVAVSSMLLAALVLITSSPKLARAAITQGITPLIAVVFLVLALATA
jgi:putative membrane protein